MGIFFPCFAFYLHDAFYYDRFVSPEKPDINIQRETDMPNLAKILEKSAAYTVILRLIEALNLDELSADKLIELDTYIADQQQAAESSFEEAVEEDGAENADEITRHGLELKTLVQNLQEKKEAVLKALALKLPIPVSVDSDDDLEESASTSPKLEWKDLPPVATALEAPFGTTSHTDTLTQADVSLASRETKKASKVDDRDSEYFSSSESSSASTDPLILPPFAKDDRDSGYFSDSESSSSSTNPGVLPSPAKTESSFLPDAIIRRARATSVYTPSGEPLPTTAALATVSASITYSTESDANASLSINSLNYVDTRGRLVDYLAMIKTNPQNTPLVNNYINAAEAVVAQVQRLKYSGESEQTLIKVLNATHTMVITQGKNINDYDTLAKRVEGHGSPAMMKLGKLMLVLTLAFAAISAALTSPASVAVAGIATVASGLSTLGLFGVGATTGLSRKMNMLSNALVAPHEADKRAAAPLL